MRLRDDRGHHPRRARSPSIVAGPGRFDHVRGGADRFRHPRQLFEDSIEACRISDQIRRPREHDRAGAAANSHAGDEAALAAGRLGLFDEVDAAGQTDDLLDLLRREHEIVRQRLHAVEALARRERAAPADRAVDECRHTGGIVRHPRAGGQTNGGRRSAEATLDRSDRRVLRRRREARPCIGQPRRHEQRLAGVGRMRVLGDRRAGDMRLLPRQREPIADAADDARHERRTHAGLLPVAKMISRFVGSASISRCIRRSSPDSVARP